MPYMRWVPQPLHSDVDCGMLRLQVKPNVTKFWGPPEADIFLGEKHISTIHYDWYHDGPMWYLRTLRGDVPVGRTPKAAALTVMYHQGYLGELPKEEEE